MALLKDPCGKTQGRPNMINVPGRGIEMPLGEVAKAVWFRALCGGQQGPQWGTRPCPPQSCLCCPAIGLTHGPSIRQDPALATSKYRSITKSGTAGALTHGTPRVDMVGDMRAVMLDGMSRRHGKTWQDGLKIK